MSRWPDRLLRLIVQRRTWYVLTWFAALGLTTLHWHLARHMFDPPRDDYKRTINEQMERLHVHHLGRLRTSVDVWTEYAKSGIWCFPSMWCETGCQTAMEAQAFGAIPIWNPHWATIENCRHGIPILGDPYTDQLVRMRFVQEVVNLAVNPELQEEIRSEMMPDARIRFHFSNVVDRIIEATASAYGKSELNLAAR